VHYFVTGATGFIGRHLCRRLVAEGHEVAALVRSPHKASALPPEVRIIQGDLTAFADPEFAPGPFDVIVHLAGVVTASDPSQYEAINYTATLDLRAWIERQPWTPRRLLFASSLAAAGPSDYERPWTEADPLQPADPYGDAKARSEAALRDAPFPVTAFRPAITFGPEDEATRTLFRSADQGIGIRVAGRPQRVAWVDVRDVVDALLLMGADQRPGFVAYFVSHPRLVTVNELWDAMRQAVRPRILVIPLPRWVLYTAMVVATAAARLIPFKNQLDDKQYRQMAAPAFICSSEALRRDLGWSPRHDLEESVDHAARAFRSAGVLKDRG
jgi:nucleoside-diphosphate-sugar epimerase